MASSQAGRMAMTHAQAGSGVQAAQIRRTVPATKGGKAGKATKAAPVSLPRHASLLRIVASGLTPATQFASPADVVRGHLAMQGQQVSAIPHALLARLPQEQTLADVQAAFERGEIVRSWPMRGTVHIMAAEDHHWLRQVLRHRTQSWLPLLPDGGAQHAILDRALEVAHAVIAQAQSEDEPGASRAALLAAWEETGVIAAAHESLASVGLSTTDASVYVRRHLVIGLHVRGDLVQGPKRGNEHLIIDAASLPGAQDEARLSAIAKGDSEYRAAVAEIARRYALSHGPVSAADLARWTTLPMGECRTALEDALEDTATGSVAGSVPLTRAVAEGGVRGRVLAVGQEGKPAPDQLYMRADLPDLLAEHEQAAKKTLFLGAFDELHVGYKDRSCLTDDEGERLICPAMNGMFRPLLVDGGALVAVRPASGELLWDERVRRSARLERDVQRAITRMERRLAA